MASAEHSSAEVAMVQSVAQPSSPAVEQHLNVSQEVGQLEGQDIAYPGFEGTTVQDQSVVSRYPSISSQVLQNVKDLKEEILNGQHATVSAPQDVDAEDEEFEEQVDVVLKSFEIKREDEREEASQDKQLDTVEKPESSEVDEGAGLKRDAQSMLKSDKDQPAQQSSIVTATNGEERDAKRARYEQDQDQNSRAAVSNGSAGSNVNAIRKPSVSESRLSHKDSQAGRPRSPSRTAAGQRGPPSDGRSLDPRNSRSYNDDRFSNSNRSGLSTYTDRLSSNSSRRDQERDRMEQARARGEPPYEQRSDREYRDRERFERGSNDRREFERPLPPTDKEPKLSLRDRIEGIPPARRPSPPLSAASGGASGRSTTKYSRPPVPLDAAGHPIREPVRDDPRGEYDSRRNASGRERYDGPAGPPGHDNRAVQRTSSMPERITDSRSFPPKNVTSYNDAKGSVPSSRPPWEEQSRNSPPASSAGTRYSQPASTYRSKEPPRSNPNVVYSRPPVPRDSVQPSLATRGSSPPPRRGYEAPSSASGRSVAPPRDYAYGGPTASAPEPHVANRSTYDRYGAPTPPADAYRNDSRGSDYRAPPPVGPPSGRPYPSAGLPPVAVDPYAHPSYDRQPPQYDRYGRPIPLDQGPPASYAPPPVARSAPVYAAPPPVSDVDAELEGLKLRLLELERRREAERDAEIARTMPRSFQNGPPVSHMPIDTGYGGRGEPINNGRGYVPREREREREREPAGSYLSRNPPPLAERREPAYANSRNGPPPGDFPPRTGPVYRASGRRTPPPMGRDDRPRR